MKSLAAPEKCLLAGFVACALVAVSAIGDEAAAAQAWLAACLFFIGLPIGALFLSLIHVLTGGVWGEVLRPALSGMTRCAPMLALFMLPVLIGVRLVYPWANGDGQGWLDWRFFDLRAVLYLLVWNGIAFLASRPMARGTAWPCLIILFITSSLAAFDWIMTLEPRWTSSIFGLLVTSGWVLSAMACAVAIAAWRIPAGLEIPARLLLVAVMLWAYFSTIQFIVIWESNLPAEIPYYLKRVAGGWALSAGAIALFQFAVPFLILLWSPLRRSRRAVLIAAFSVIAGHLLEIWWLTAPDFSRPFGWREPLAMAAVGLCIVPLLEGMPFPTLWPKVSHGRG